MVNFFFAIPPHFMALAVARGFTTTFVKNLIKMHLNSWGCGGGLVIIN